MRAVVTGASNGIGREIAVVLAEQGWELVLVARSADKMRELASQLKTPATIIACDLSLESSCRELHQQLADTPVDLLVNNAGFGHYGPFNEHDLANDLNMIDLNIRSLHLLTRLFLKDFCAAGKGRILNVASVAGFMPGPLMATYYATKAYVLRMSQALSVELRGEGSPVHVSVLCPGPVATGFCERAEASFAFRGLPARRVAEVAVRDTLRGKTIITPGLLTKFMMISPRFLPWRVHAWFTLRVQRSRRPAQ